MCYGYGFVALHKEAEEIYGIARGMGLGGSQLNDLHRRRLGWEQDDLV
jgi:hypothetical protein